MRLLYIRTQFVEDGILTGKTSRTIERSSLGDHLADIARELTAPDTWE